MGTKLKGVYIPEKILTDSQLGPTHKLVYAVMVMNTDENGICRMNAQEIAARLGISLKSATCARMALAKRGHVRKMFRAQGQWEYEVVMLHRRWDDA